MSVNEIERYLEQCPYRVSSEFQGPFLIPLTQEHLPEGLKNTFPPGSRLERFTPVGIPSKEGTHFECHVRQISLNPEDRDSMGYLQWCKHIRGSRGAPPLTNPNLPSGTLGKGYLPFWGPNYIKARRMGEFKVELEMSPGTGCFWFRKEKGPLPAVYFNHNVNTRHSWVEVILLETNSQLYKELNYFPGDYELI